jgi:hypothetical protein
MFIPNQLEGVYKFWPLLVSKDIESKEEKALAYARNAFPGLDLKFGKLFYLLTGNI